MGQLENMQLFIKVVELGSITKAADNLSIAKSAVSRRLNELESSLGVKLIQRTTRQSHLTEAGQSYYQKCKLIVSEVEELHNELTSQQQMLTGVLKLAVPLSFGVTHLIPALDAFLQKHEELKLDIHFSDRKVDIINEGFDLAFRIGNLKDSSMRAKKITTIRHILCASPHYLERNGEPLEAKDLSKHKFLKYSDIPTTGFNLVDESGNPQPVHLNVCCNANNGDFLKSMALAGHGITLIPTFIAWKELAAGDLIPVLKDFKLPDMSAYAIFPEARYMPPKVRFLIDFLVERLRNNPYWDQK